jgi:plastocyanin
MSRRVVSWITLALGVSLAFTGTACGQTPKPLPKSATAAPAAAPTPDVPHSVVITDSMFVPGMLRITRGSSVTWRNAGAAAQTVTGDGFDRGNLEHRGTFTRIFKSPGTFRYHSAKNPQMTGVIVVK